jgi:hypothetical protein
MPDVLLQTRVPPPIARWVNRRADEEGDTVAGWLRRHLTKEASMARVKAWIYPLRQTDPRGTLYTRPPAMYFFERLRELSPTAAVHAICYGETTSRPGHPVRGEMELLDTTWFRDLADARVTLDGGPRPHRILNVVYNSTQQYWEITTEVDLAYPTAA